MTIQWAFKSKTTRLRAARVLLGGCGHLSRRVTSGRLRAGRSALKRVIANAPGASVSSFAATTILGIFVPPPSTTNQDRSNRHSKSLCLVANGLDVVTVRIEHVGAVVVGVV